MHEFRCKLFSHKLPAISAMYLHNIRTPCSRNTLILLLLVLAPWLSTAAPGVNETTKPTDRETLLCAKSHLFLSNSTGALSTWSNGTSLDVCLWQGVSCSARRVTALNLEGQGLGGQIPACISNLTHLARIHLLLNQLRGPVPPELGQLRRLEYMNLSSNALSGLIPYELGFCSVLGVISLMNNSFDGGIPAALFNISLIQVVDLRMNNLSGIVPHLVPYSCMNLQELSLTENSLSGEIPSSLGNLSLLTTLRAAENQLTGNVPDSLGRLTKLQIFDFTMNNLSGIVPITLYNLSSLTFLGLGNNGFVGKLPSTMGITLPNVETIAMSVNKLEGEIPKSLANATNLVYIFLARNSFSGVIPSLGTSVNLRKLVLFENRGLEAGDWKFLSCLSNCTQLDALLLDGNKLQGNFPNSVGNLSRNLEFLVLGSNQLTGTIPSGIFDLVGLKVLYLDNNMLTGPIPDSFGNLHNLFALNMTKNRFYGSIPTSIGNLESLSELYFKENRLSGVIPAQLARCEKLAALDLSSNSLGGPIPKGLFSKLNQLTFLLDLSNNKLTQSIPDDVGSLINLQSFNISNNNISGKIPSTFGSCVLLESLRLEGNRLEGRIPSSLATLKGIKDVDFSQNGLSGEIPEFFELFDSLGYLNLSFNNFDGPLPTKGIFSNATGKIFLQGNPRIMSYNDLSNATNGFCSENLIGSGQSGLVYKGSLPDEIGQMIAVKVFKTGLSGASKSFLTECRAFRNMRHRNIVKVFTACSTYDPLGNEFKALVMEYMSNGTLADRLHSKSPRNDPLSLEARICIAVDVASVLEYLHIWSVPSMVHCDLKPSNILFDDDNLARVGDFGLARFLHAFSSSEYGMGSRLSTEGDIYSYGIVLLEMLTGKHPTDELFDDGFTLHKYVEEALPQICGILDLDLSKEIGGDNSSHTQSQEQGNKTYVHKCVLQLLNLGLLCSEEAPTDRPGIQDVYSEVVAVKEYFLSCRVKETLEIISGGSIEN
ncbi:hypothetical protein HU200_053495 [Digitaria exilis]|uniref:non-specific serine/threonine protein kinase n=1 Tax=Digitaria exilis TaxID=1010633 RepID=A0A835ALZ8_9POAL|nr:hypothetical protein HU200_053495 [Digitaria exilis]